MRKLLLPYLMVFTIACSSQVASDSDAFLPGKRLAELSSKKLEEVSGLGASEVNKGYLWTHNDSGNDAEVFLIDTALNIKLRCVLKGIQNRDWEDICVGPGPVKGKTYVYVADIGDNFAQYQLKFIYRFEEPLLDPSKPDTVITDFDTITFQLAGERKDTESIMIDPQSKDLFVVSKREQPVHVYELKYPQSTNDTLTASDIGTLPLTGIVAADFSADRKEILMKNYVNVFYWKLTPNKSVADVLKENGKVLRYTEEPQGEAIAWSRDGKGFYTLSEKKKKEKSFLYFYQRK